MTDPSAKPASRSGEVELALRDGSRVGVRPIEPGDKEVLRRGFERLSDRSRHQRFLAPTPRLTASQLAYLTEVDHRDHEALIAFDAATREGVGVARYVREPGSGAAEAAVTVIDDWQGRGLGTALTEMIAERAREEGIERFVALLLVENRDMLDLLRSLGDVRVTGRDAGTIEVEVPLPEPEMLRGVLRASAAGAELAAPPGNPPPGED